MEGGASADDETEKSNKSSGTNDNDGGGGGSPRRASQRAEDEAEESSSDSQQSSTTSSGPRMEQGRSSGDDATEYPGNGNTDSRSETDTGTEDATASPSGRDGPRMEQGRSGETNGSDMGPRRDDTQTAEIGGRRSAGSKRDHGSVSSETFQENYAERGIERQTGEDVEVDIQDDGDVEVTRESSSDRYGTGAARNKAQAAQTDVKRSGLSETVLKRQAKQAEKRLEKQYSGLDINVGYTESGDLTIENVEQKEQFGDYQVNIPFTGGKSVEDYLKSGSRMSVTRFVIPQVRSSTRAALPRSPSSRKDLRPLDKRRPRPSSRRTSGRSARGPSRVRPTSRTSPASRSG